jgi:hypothetical protein
MNKIAVLTLFVVVLGVLFGVAGFVLDGEPSFSKDKIPVYGLTKQVDNLANRYLGLEGKSKDFPDGWNKPAVFRNGVNTKKWLAPRVLVQEAFWQQEVRTRSLVIFDLCFR